MEEKYQTIPSLYYVCALILATRTSSPFMGEAEEERREGRKNENPSGYLLVLACLLIITSRFGDFGLLDDALLDSCFVSVC
uniref:Uncharacterized protein n=1 Tax=Acrobeloides nanus TaxID=290746 RepID=A0A914DIM7_9BILA